MPVQLSVMTVTVADCTRRRNSADGIVAEYLLADKRYYTNQALGQCGPMG